MADSYTGLTQLLKLNNANAVDLGASDIFNSAPILAKMAATESSQGKKHTYLKYSTSPTSGFRAANDGVENSISLDTEVTVDLSILDASWQEDIMTVRAYKGGVDAFMARESNRHLRKALADAERQMFYGTTALGNAAGFVGLANSTRHDSIADTANVVNAGGTTAGTASSVWLIRSVDPVTDVAVVLKDGEIKIEPYYQTVAAGSATGRLDVYRQPITGHIGLQLGANFSAVRICNLTADAGKGLTDSLIASALELFPADAQPNMIVGSMRSAGQLRRSRTATNATGQEVPYVTDIFGIPFYVSPNIVNTEALLT